MEIDNLAGEEEKPQREAKHVALDRAISSIYGVKDHALKLLDLITGNSTPETETAEDHEKLGPRESLLVLLDEGPDRIKLICDETHEILQTITTKLF